MSLTAIPHIEIIEGAALSDFTTFKLGGPCKALISCRSPQQLEQIVEKLNAQHEKFILIGGGSNLVVSDSGLDCYVLRYVSDEPIIERQGNDVIVGAGTVLDHLALYALAQSLEGVNYCSGIPGTVGGAVVGNAGAFGKQIGDVLIDATLLSLRGEIKTLRHDELGFQYRHSKLKETNDIVLSVRLRLTPADKKSLQQEREEILAIRREKHPNLTTHPCAGSFFRNIEPTSKAGKRQATGWFLEEAGGKNLSMGGAKIFDKHANIIVKADGCRAEDVYNLQKKMVALVKEKFGLDLVREVRFVGEFKEKPSDVKQLIW